MSDELNNQAAVIDEGQTAADPFANLPTVSMSEIDAEEAAAPDLVQGLSDKGKAVMKQEAQYMPDQIQDEFKEWDPELDAGIKSGDNQNDTRADNQGGWAETGRFLVGFANEAVVGSAEAIALVADADMHAKAFMGIEQDFSNTLTEKIAEFKQQNAEKYGKVYVHSDNEGFDPTSREFWLSNGSSAASALTLMVPGMMAVKGLGALTKASKIARALRMGQKSQAAVRGLTGAIISRLGENAMEASEAVTSVRDELSQVIDVETGEPKYTEEEINQIAGQAGVDTWRSNWAMITTDFMQFSKAFKGIDYARRSTANATKKAFLKNAGKFIASDMGSEALEEGYQYMSSQEAQYKAKQSAGIGDHKHVSERIYDYLHEDELYTSMTMGAVGGGLFAAAGRVTAAKEEASQERMRQRMNDFRKEKEASILGDAKKFERAEDITLVSEALSKSADGNLEAMEADISNLENTSDEELLADGRNPIEYRAKVARAKGIIKMVGKEYNRAVEFAEEGKGLRKAVSMSRIAGKMAEIQKKDLSKLREELDELDLEVFNAAESSTSQMMVRLNTLIRNNNSKKADQVVEDILSISDKYSSKAQVLSALETTQSDSHRDLNEVEKGLDLDISRAKKVEEQLKSKEGREKLRKEAAIAYETDAAARKAAVLAERPNTTEGQMQVELERQTAAQKFGERDLGEPDGDKVFTIGSKRGNRTFKKGETIKDKQGNHYRVLGRAGDYMDGVHLKHINADGSERKPPKGRKLIFMENDVSKYAPESLQAGDSAWKVNKLIDEDLHETVRVHNRGARGDQDTVDGVTHGYSSEFDNFKTNKWGNMQFPDSEEGGPSPRTDNAYPIDFDLAAAPMEDGKPIPVTLVLGKERIAGVPDILVMQGDKIITYLGREGREHQHQVLVELIKSKNGKLEADVTDKYVTYQGNLGNIAGAQNNVKDTLKDSAYKHKGKLWIGSRKGADATSITFVAEDGEVMDLPISEGMKKGSGNTFTVINNPAGQPVAVRLRESMMGDVDHKSGGTLAEHANVVMHEVAAELNAEINEKIDSLVAKGMLEREAIVEVRDAYALDEDGKATKKNSVIARRFNERMQGLVRTTNERKTVDKDGNDVWVTTKNFFNLRLEYEDSSTDVQGATVVGRGSVVPKLTVATPGFVDADGKQTYKKKVVPVEEITDEISARPTWVELDAMTGDGKYENSTDKERGNYVKKVLEKSWVTTDIYAKRVWVNPRIKIQLSEEAKNATAQGVKVRPIRKVKHSKYDVKLPGTDPVDSTKPKQNPKAGKGNNAAGTVSEKVVITDAERQAFVMKAASNTRKLVSQISDLGMEVADKSAPTIKQEELFNLYFADTPVTFKEFDAKVSAKFQEEMKIDGIDNMTAGKNAFTSVVGERVKEGFASGDFNTLIESHGVLVPGKSEAATEVENAAPEVEEAVAEVEDASKSTKTKKTAGKETPADPTQELKESITFEKSSKPKRGRSNLETKEFNKSTTKSSDVKQTTGKGKSVKADAVINQAVNEGQKEPKCKTE